MAAAGSVRVQCSAFVQMTYEGTDSRIYSDRSLKRSPLSLIIFAMLSDVKFYNLNLKRSPIAGVTAAALRSLRSKA